MAAAPKVDPRTAAEIAGQVRHFLKLYTDQTFPAGKKGAADALINIFARYAELIVERLNRVPEKNFLAFLDLIGASPLPPQPARAPLTFTLAEGSAVDTVVPAGTQVAAAPAEGEAGPAIFETERELVVTAARLSSIFTRDAARDASADLSSILYRVPPGGVAVFEAARQKDEHVLYLSHDALFGHPHLSELSLTFTMKEKVTNPLDAAWEIWDGTDWRPVPVRATGAAANLGDSGDVKLTNLSALLPTTVNGLTARWLRCRLTTRIPPAVKGKPPVVEPVNAPTVLLPDVESVKVQAVLERKGLAVGNAIANDTPVEVVKGFLPFGERPKIGDALYLSHKEAFGEAGAKIALHFTVTNSPRASNNLALAYEFWDGNAWSAVTELQDGTNSLKKTGAGDVKFTIPRQPVATTINGVQSFWIRARIASGNYGAEAHFALRDPNNPSAGYLYADADLGQSPPYFGDPAKGYKLVPATYAPPFVGALTVDYAATRPAQPAPPEVVLTHNDFAYRAVAGGAFKPFEPLPNTGPALHLGFELPAGRKSFPQRKISLYAELHEYQFGDQPAEVSGDGAPSDEHPQLDWEYSTATGWAKLLIRDGTENFTRSGLVEFFGPADFARRGEFGLERYWIRVAWNGGRYGFAPRLRRALLNTTMAAQTVTVRGEVLGSSDGSKNQKFKTTRAPVLEGEQVEVREPGQTVALERERLRKDEGERGAAAGGDPSNGVWVRWTEVADFYGSGASDRHYVVDHVTGEVRFGDGASGMIPPTASGNVRMSQYKTGGGTAGNKPAGTITQLKTTVPYVESVTNHLAARGGANAETPDSLLKRAPRTVRHRDRAVTIQDYQDLAMLASPEVARARCVPLFDPSGKAKKPGTVGLIIVPRSSDARPTPSVELIERVRRYVDARRAPTSKLIVVGPEYIPVGVTVAVALTSMEGASEVELAIARSLSRFLHPLTGGWDGVGWAFGRRPHRSDLYALIGAVAGVGHVHSLAVAPPEKTFEADRFLIYSGEHTITLSLEGAHSAPA